jgi:hypothetical protein
MARVSAARLLWRRWVAGSTGYTYLNFDEEVLRSAA